MSQPYKEAILTNLNQSVNMTNPAGCLEITGTWTGPATVTQSLTGGTTAVDSFTADETIYTKASHSTFALTGGNGPVTVRWYYDVSNSNESPVNRLSKG